MFRKGKHWGDMPSSSDLASLVKCEVEFVHERNTGQERVDAETRMKSARGQREHDRTQARMEAFHNRAPATDGRCFVASAAFGESAPETNVLRSYRDRVLMPSKVGRKVVEMYYQVSPPLAEFVARNPTAQVATRRVLGWVAKKVA